MKAKSGTMIIAQITDTHLGAANAADPMFGARAENLRECVADINGLDPMPDAVIHTGDMTQHGQAAEYVHARSLLAALGVPLYVTPGNRDGRQEMARAFAGDGYIKPDCAFVHYAVEKHPVRLVAVDSLAADGSTKGDLCHDRLAALDATLAEAPAQPTALFMHHPPFDVTTAPDPFAYQRRGAAADLAAVVSRHPQVIRIFAGHMHRPWLATVGGVAASTVPSIAVDLRKGRYAPTMAGRPVYQVHRFEGDLGFASETRLAGS
ncbi:MAG: metallophosphoesterase [Rhodospirillales bacterium]|jgi:3',5'-cyclic AMP phosphodiesterase CpdA|nr:metallophosphoesterase [Rhodospirillales bacterium]HJO97582.1 metallophosphoesterase [Rhodospirillales bacterium]